MIKRGRYRHFKGKEYEVLDFATHSETLELMVLISPALWGRKALGSPCFHVGGNGRGGRQTCSPLYLSFLSICNANCANLLFKGSSVER